MRPVNVIITGLSVFLGAAICGNIGENALSVILAIISASIVAAAGNAINDYFDVEIDRINKPERPLPSGTLSPNHARIFYFMLIFISMVLSVFISIQALTIVIIVNILLFFYSKRLKRTAIWGNLTVSLVSALAFIYGGISVGNVRQAWIPAAFAFLFHLGREIVKDVEDVKGDKASQADTIAIKFGAKTAINIASGVFILLIITTLLPYIFDLYNLAYLIIVIFGVDLGLIFIMFALHKNYTTPKLNQINTILKFQMVIGIISILVGTR
jgi:geranylgeranylglycerol-phosphate geranylgeranyltransferase